MATKHVLVCGGKGALGSVCVSTFKAQKWWVGCIDTKENEIADANILINRDSSLTEQESSVLKELSSVLINNQLDAVICVAGGWAGGNASSKDFVKNCELTWKQSVASSVLAVSVAAKLLKSGGLLSLTGASAAFLATPGMIGYGMAKASVHHLTKSLSNDESGLPANSTTVCIVPETLDTPMNRKWMPKADRSTWTSLEFISNLFLKWINNEDRPPNGSFVELFTICGETKIRIV